MFYLSKNPTTGKNLKPLGQARLVLQTKYYSYKTEKSYINWIMALLLCGAGLRLSECLQLRVKDIISNIRVAFY